MKDQVDSNGISIAYNITDHIFAYYFTKVLQGALFVKFCEVIMGWKHIDTPQMRRPSNKESAVNMYGVESRKEVIKSNIDTKNEIFLSHGNNKWHNVTT